MHVLLLSNLIKKSKVSYFLELCISSTNEALIIPVGIATIPIPTNDIIEAKILPHTVTGTTSP